MKAVILAGGLGTRLSEETTVKPKPMVEIGGKPILWHLMKILSSYGINDFIICCGYKGYYIKEYFQNYCLRNSDIKFNTKNSSSEILKNSPEQWNVTCVDTGETTLTGGRLKRVREYLDPNESFLFIIKYLILFSSEYLYVITPKLVIGSLHLLNECPVIPQLLQKYCFKFISS